MKRRVFILLLIVFFIISTFSGCGGKTLEDTWAFAIFHYIFGPIISIPSNNVVIHPTYESPANQYQYGASVWMREYNGELWFAYNDGGLHHKNPYDLWLCAFEDGGVTKKLKMAEEEYTQILGYNSHYLYYCFTPNSKEIEIPQKSLIGCDMDTLEKTVIQPATDVYEKNAIVYGDDTIRLPLNGEQKNGIQFYLHLDGKSVIGVSTLEHGFMAGENEYSISIQDPAKADQILCKSPDGRITITSSKMGWAEERSIIPTDSGILVHNVSGDHMLYFICKDGTVRELFRAECERSLSSVTVYKDVAYLSFMRFEKHSSGWLGWDRYENDTIEGTYAIDLNRFTYTKISDEIYDGMYIFDDTGIYACDRNKCIYKLDFNGNVLETLMKVRGSL